MQRRAAKAGPAAPRAAAQLNLHEGMTLYMKRRAILAAAAAAVVIFTALRLPETRHDEFWTSHRARTQNHTIAGLGPAEEGA